jgi:hypothetical protein
MSPDKHKLLLISRLLSLHSTNSQIEEEYALWRDAVVAACKYPAGRLVFLQFIIPPIIMSSKSAT